MVLKYAGGQTDEQTDRQPDTLIRSQYSASLPERSNDKERSPAHAHATELFLLSSVNKDEHKTPHFPYPHWSSPVEFGITGYYDPGRLPLAGSQDTDLSCHEPISTFCCTV